jgi:hypothetical protein
MRKNDGLAISDDGEGEDGYLLEGHLELVKNF